MNLRKLLSPILLCLSALISLHCFSQPKELIYVGTYSVRDSKGIYVLEFDRAKASLKIVNSVSDVRNPSFLALTPDGKFLFAAAELNAGGAVASFSLDDAGNLKFINQQSSGGAGAAHIAVDQTGKLAFVSNYGAGSLAVLGISPNGSLMPASDVIPHEGGSINRERQQKSHVHSITISPDNQYALVADLGTDKIYSYTIDHAAGRIKTTPASTLSVVPGAGPRHLAFHPDGVHLYAVEELYSTVGVFSYNKKTGALQTVRDTVRSLPMDFKTFNKSADIHVLPNGRFLYMSNRGLDAIVIYAITKDGGITLVGQQPVMGKTPRNFLIDPRGEFMFVANQDSDNIVIFRIDPKTGKLEYTGNQLSVPSPVCLKFLKK